MKKLNLFVLLAAGFMFLAQTGFSQRPIYVMGGVQHAWISGDNESWSTGLIGGQVGVGILLANLSERVGFRGELNYSMQGSNWEDDFGEGTESGHVSASYLNLPLVLRYMFSPGNSGLFGELGVQPGLLLSAKDHFDGGTDDFKEFMNDFDFGIPVGVGYELNGNLGVGLRYIMGLSNIWSESDSGTDHNNVLALRLTWTFNK